MSALSVLQQDLKFLVGGVKVLAWTRDVTPDSAVLVPDDVEAAVDKHRHSVAFRFDGELMTYAEFDSLANRYANWAVTEGVQPGANHVARGVHGSAHAAVGAAFLHHEGGEVHHVAHRIGGGLKRHALGLSLLVQLMREPVRPLAGGGVHNLAALQRQPVFGGQRFHLRP